MKKEKGCTMNDIEKTDVEIRMTIGKKIQAERARRHQSADRVAKKLGMSRVALTHIENGRNNINSIQLWKLSCILGCDIEDFFPPTPRDYALSPIDYEKIGREDKKAEIWARKLFEKKF